MRPTVQDGGVIWITGLSGAGKTTLARKLQEKINAKTILLDGDELRKVLDMQTGLYDIEGRKKVASIYSRLSNMLSNQGFLVIIATISMYEEIREWNRKHIVRYIEIYLNVSEEERRNRDPKNLYKDNKSNMAGVNLEVELPQNPDMIFSEKDSIEDMINKIIQEIG